MSSHALAASCSRSGALAAAAPTASRRRGAAAAAASACRAQHHQQHCAAVEPPPALAPPPALRRRDAVAASAAALLAAAAACLPGAAAAAAVAEATSPTPAATEQQQQQQQPSTSSASPSPELQHFLDNEYELDVPADYSFLETPIVRVERGPQPERSPVLARFEPSGGGPGVISILARKAQALKQTLLQVADISQLGPPEEVAGLLMPRGSTLLATATTTIERPPRETPLGLVEIPPQRYYVFEFTTPNGLHVALAAAARRGSVYICGASAPAELWPQAGPVYRRVAESFRLRSQPTLS